MRVLFTITPWKGIYFCVVPLGWALQAAGHEVRVACAPSQAEAVSQAGLAPISILDATNHTLVERVARYAEAVKAGEVAPGGVPVLHPETGRPVRDLDEYDLEAGQRRVREHRAAVAARSHDAAVRFARAWRPHLVVHDVMAPEGALAARVTGVPSVCYSPGMFGGREAAFSVPVQVFERYGVPAKRAITHVIDPTPDVLLPDHGDATRLPVRYLPYNGAYEVPEWLLEPPARPRVCLLWGPSASSLFGTGIPALRYAIDAVLQHDVELVLTAAPEQVAALGELPGVRMLRNCPVQLLLAVSDAMIHQGSINPKMSAAAAGVPQLCLSLTDDQTEMCRRYAAGGSLLHLPGLGATAGQVRDAVATLLTDARLHDAAKAIQADMNRHPAPAGLVAPLEQLAAEAAEG